MKSILLIRRTNLFFVVACCVLFLVLLFSIVIFLNHSFKSILFPYPLDYGEGPVLHQALGLSQFKNIYHSLSFPPYVFANYTPLYPVLLVPFIWIFETGFWYGRLINLICIVITSLSIGMILYETTKDKITSLIGSLILFSLPQIVNWSTYCRVDTLALCLSCLVLYIAVKSNNSKTLLFCQFFS